MGFEIIKTFLMISACVASISCFIQGGHIGDNLEALCQNKTIGLAKLSQLNALNRKLDDDGGVACLDNTVSALRDLKSVVDANKRQECTMEAYERYRKFYMMYLDTSSEERKKDFVELPGSLRDFALAYGVQIASLCRANMVTGLLQDAGAVVSEDEFDEIEEVIGVDGPIAKALGYGGSRPDEIVLPSDFLAVFSKASSKKVALKVKTAPLLIRLYKLCERRFKPVYEPLMIPVAKMGNLGFDHRGGVLKDAIQNAMKGEDTQDVIGRWSRVAFMCEIMDELEIVEESGDIEQSAGNDVTQVHVLTKDQADELKQRGGRSLLENALSQETGLEQAIFNPKLYVDLPDEILTRKSHKVAVRSIDTNRNEVFNIRKRFLLKVVRRLMSDIRNQRLSDVFKSLFKELKDSMKSKGQKQSEATGTDIVSSLNRLVDSELYPDKTVAQYYQQPYGYQDESPAAAGIIVGIIIFVVVIVIIGVIIEACTWHGGGYYGGGYYHGVTIIHHHYWG